MKKFYTICCSLMICFVCLGTIDIQALAATKGKTRLVEETMSIDEIVKLAKENDIELSFDESKVEKKDLVTLVNDLYLVGSHDNTVQVNEDDLIANSEEIGEIKGRAADASIRMKRYTGATYTTGGRSILLYVTVRFKTYEERSGYKSISSIESVTSSLTNGGVSIGESWAQDSYSSRKVASGTKSYNINGKGTYSNKVGVATGSVRCNFSLTIKSTTGSYV